jgi:hypothetical protein
VVKEPCAFTAAVHYPSMITDTCIPSRPSSFLLDPVMQASNLAPPNPCPWRSAPEHRRRRKRILQAPLTGDGHAGMKPLLILQLGRSYVLVIRDTFSRPRAPGLGPQRDAGAASAKWADTVLVPPRQTADHQVSGLMAVLSRRMNHSQHGELT